MLRNGMWCVDQDGRVGIFRYQAVLAKGRGKNEYRRDPQFRPQDGKPEFHVTDANGVVLFVVPAYGRALRQARADQIPQKRRPTREVLGRFGYAT